MASEAFLRLVCSTPMEPRSHTKIVCTLGPKTASIEEIKKLWTKGMSIARLNLSHGDLTYHSRVIDNIRAVEKETGHRIFIALDTRGPEFRVFCKAPLSVVEGDLVKIMKTAELKNPSSLDEGMHTIGADVDDFGFLELGSTITFDDKRLSMLVEGVGPDSIMCKSLGTHLLENNKRICFPRGFKNKTFLDDADIEGLRLGLEKGIDVVFLSFVEKAADISKARALLKDRSIMVVSKVESRAGVENIDAIVEASDGIMVARGDLFNNVGLETMFSTQKLLIRSCKTKPVIMATEMLYHMMYEPTPLRSEIADIGYSVIDGCSAVMLSGETACGKYPSESVDVMRKVCIDAEKYMGCDHRSMEVEALSSEGICFVSSRKVDRRLMFKRGVYFHADGTCRGHSPAIE